MKREEKSEYEIGYGKPPKQSQFKKGHSGNPKGRPRALAGPDSYLMRELNSLITVNENGRRMRISKANAFIKQMVNSAISGNRSAARIVYSHLERVQTRMDEVAEAQPFVPTLENLHTLTEEQLEMVAQCGTVYVASDDPRLVEQHAASQKRRENS